MALALPLSEEGELASHDGSSSLRVEVDESVDEEGACPLVALGEP